jgi:PPK2 family polyphosphate:nucleotide phosphotransferase
MPSGKLPNRRSLERYTQARPGADFDLSQLDPGEKPFSSGSKPDDRARVEELAVELDDLQNLLFADGRHALLLVLQGVDTSGKDGTLRAVLGRMSPLGVRTVAFKVPSEEERAHDVLWRIHRQVPQLGELVAFNRSHYEDVLVPVVEGALGEQDLLRRYAQINEFERLLTETGTTVVKFMLHISRDEQRKRLQQRIDNPTKRWKFQPGDLEAREKWDDYQRAYERAISMTGTPWAPWTVVPADSKTQRNLMVATLLKQVLQAMDLRFPDCQAIASIKVT